MSIAPERGGYGSWRPEPWDRAESRYGYGQHRGKGPKNYQRSDSRIQEDVNDALTDDPRIDATNIEVTVNNGEVTINGTVSGSRRQQQTTS
jgi:osmotically-inducible protein OsmY